MSRSVRHRRGRRRLPRQPRPGGVRRAAQGRRDRRGDRRARRDDRHRDQQRRGVPRPDRRPRARRRARAGGRDRGPDGLQAGRRADGRQLEDQAPLDEAAGDRGQPARPDRHDVHLGAARRERPRRPARQRGARRLAGRQRPLDADGIERGGARARPGRVRGAEPRRGWGPPGGDKPTTLVLVRHGVTDADHRQALLRRAGQQQPAAQRRGPRAGPGDGGVAGAAVRHLRRAGQLPGAAYARDRGDPGRVLRPRDRGGARHRRDGVRHLGRDELHRGAREVARRARPPGSATSSPRRTAASRSVPWRSGCSRGATG